MKATLDWLKQSTAFVWPPAELTKLFTMLSLPMLAKQRILRA